MVAADTRPFTAADRKAGHRYDISVRQVEFSTTHVLDRRGRRRRGHALYSEPLGRRVDSFAERGDNVLQQT
jgi:hypothetical protein